MALRRIAACLLLSFLCACSGGVSKLPRISKRESIQVTSSAFTNGGRIPARFTCDGEEVAPPLRWTGGPPAEEYAVVVVDRNADEFVHWIVYGIPGTVTSLGPDAAAPGATQGRNSFDKLGYGGPCPPQTGSAHVYVFTVYSLRLPRAARVPSGASLEEVVDAIRCCIQAQGSLTGTYER